MLQDASYELKLETSASAAMNCNNVHFCTPQAGNFYPAGGQDKSSILSD
jgi:hypothetical protein